jgi:uncharacterized membrane protein
MKKLGKMNIVLIAAVMATFALTLYVYKDLPEMIPTHWNFSGKVDGWSPKMPYAFMLPAISLAMLIMFAVLPKIDPRKENYPRFKKQYDILRWIVVILFLCLQMLTIATSLGMEMTGMDVIFRLPVALIFVSMGVLMPKFKHNYFVGIKTPWTLHSEEVWDRTHEHGGKVWIWCGIALALVSFWNGFPMNYVYPAIILFAALEPVVYSYIISRK